MVIRILLVVFQGFSCSNSALSGLFVLLVFLLSSMTPIDRRVLKTLSKFS